MLSDKQTHRIITPITVAIHSFHARLQIASLYISRSLPLTLPLSSFIQNINKTHSRVHFTGFFDAATECALWLSVSISLSLHDHVHCVPAAARAAQRQQHNCEGVTLSAAVATTIKSNWLCAFFVLFVAACTTGSRHDCAVYCLCLCMTHALFAWPTRSIAFGIVAIIVAPHSEFSSIRTDNEDEARARGEARDKEFTSYFKTATKQQQKE